VSWFLDTNTCIYYLKGKSAPVCEQLLRCRPDDIKIPALVKAELWLGVLGSQRRQENEERLLAFLAPFEVVSFDDACTRPYAELRLHTESTGRLVGPNDMVIAATVLAHGGVLVTNNEGEFRRVPGLQVENWTLPQA
jgi:tRNA(fMet)-specific endonuclease VapC